MNCRDFDRWLDQGMPARTAVAAENHRSICPVCSRAFETQRTLDALLPGVPGAATPRLIDSVMARVSSETGDPAAILFSDLDLELPLWIRTLMQPATALATVAAVCLIAWGEDFLASAVSGMDRLAGFVRLSSVLLPSAQWISDHPALAVSIVIPVSVGILALSIALYRGTLRIASG